MATKAKRPCTHPGCGELTTKGRCPTHKAQSEAARKAAQQRHDRTRGTAAQRGYNARWAAYSRQYRKDNPLCVGCMAKGKLTSVEYGGHVDHIVAVAGPDDPLFWEPTNHQSLCRTCHARKTAAEDGGMGNERKRL